MAINTTSFDPNQNANDPRTTLGRENFLRDLELREAAIPTASHEVEKTSPEAFHGNPHDPRTVLGQQALRASLDEAVRRSTFPHEGN